MTTRRPGIWAVVVVAVTLAAATFVLTAISWGDPVAEAYYWRSLVVVNALVWLVFVLVGAVIMLRRPGHGVGQILVAIGLGMLGIGGVTEYALRGALIEPGSLPVVDAVTVAGNVMWIIPFGLLPILLLVYPTGQLLSARWRIGALPAVLAMVAVLGSAIPPLRHRWPAEQLMIEDPLAASPDGLAVTVGLIFTGLILLSVALIAGIVCLAIRWRKAGRIERLQIKWLLWASGAWAGVIITVNLPALTGGGNETVIETSVVAELLNLLGLAAIPVAIGVAILRYRLYEIDRIVSRTVTYGLVTAGLIGVYVLVAVVPAAVFDLQSDLLVAAATLVAAAAFGPLRRRVQAAVDRRFNRSRYDAGQVADRFAGRLRQEVDLDELTVDLRGVVATTVQPAHLSLWLREPEALR